MELKVTKNNHLSSGLIYGRFTKEPSFFNYPKKIRTLTHFSAVSHFYTL